MARTENEDEWFEVSEDMWRDPREVPRRLKLCADASVPMSFVEKLKRAKIAIRAAREDNLCSRPDHGILAWAKRHKRVLLTFDRDFWDDRKFSLATVPGVIFLDVSPEDLNAALDAFNLLYFVLGKSFSLERWNGVKARVSSSGFILKLRTIEGHVTQYELRVKANKVVARELG
jgi:predicted nuclease of predicted toxin-antitoxin system